MELPMKRKRGRPRKIEISSVHTENNVTPTSAIETPQGSRQPEQIPVFGSKAEEEYSKIVTSSPNIADDRIGQVISGVVERTFDAGYLLNVQLAGTNTYLRGVVFRQEKAAPITAANDIAPHAKMYLRKEIPIPDMNPHMKNTQQTSVQTTEFKGHEPSLNPIPSPCMVTPVRDPTGLNIGQEEQNKANEDIVDPMKDPMLDSTAKLVAVDSNAESAKPFIRETNEMKREEPHALVDPRSSLRSPSFSERFPDVIETNSRGIRVEDEVLPIEFKPDETNVTLELSHTPGFAKCRAASPQHQDVNQELQIHHQIDFPGFISSELVCHGTGKLNLELNQPPISIDHGSTSLGGQVIGIFPSVGLLDHQVMQNQHHSTIGAMEVEKDASTCSRTTFTINAGLEQTPRYAEPIMTLGPMTKPEDHNNTTARSQEIATQIAATHRCEP